MALVRVILADHSAERRQHLRAQLTDPQIECVESKTEEEMLRYLDRSRCNIVVISGVDAGPRTQLALLELIGHHRPTCSIVFLGQARPDQALRVATVAEAVGATHCIAGECDSANDGAKELVRGESLIGSSQAIKKARASILKSALADSNVLIIGETGTGKELTAQLIHENSSRKDKALVCLNCAAIPDALLESELFGHEKGAFTSADELHRGKLEQANGGTVLLDEIGEMSGVCQAKVLRALEDKELHRLGGTRGIIVNFRIIAATNRDLHGAVKAGTFRSDLFFRINVWQIKLPPLRERREDIPELCAFFIHELNHRFRSEVDGLSAEALDKLSIYDWPGNVRELRNALEYAFMNDPKRWIHLSDLPDWLGAHDVNAQQHAETERERLVAALISCKWNKSKAARRLNWSRMTLYRKLAKHQLDAEDGIAVNAGS
jgi:DNA-binding NtrC family response regulator